MKKDIESIPRLEVMNMFLITLLVQNIGAFITCFECFEGRTKYCFTSKTIGFLRSYCTTERRIEKRV